ncbi:alcohol dehydrogenase IV [Fomitiporia mediterranea MF3/22]|uniref:alcohol dehydrogenase IV n=1 Tax=Fomitiporia mediterranea (strain MF3/22) TaxID=694068 RepID=UPI0004408EE0|nr:alcohol dehydrogenase IV [Fomitiporia mediterranea MF3/22]EJD03428.1 alcohol dehydrogenase IV [Fomitiporia mediterranea MF3/22]
MDPELQGSYAYTDPLKGVYYGPGCLKTALPKLLSTLGGKKALVVTGRSLHTKTDVVRKVEDVLKSQNAYGETFWEIGEHAPVAGINAGIDLFARVGADIIVSVGGGSPIDAAKAIVYRLHERDLSKRFLPHIAIPTTLSAAEYTVGAGYTNEKGEKVAVSDPELAPAGIILDAELTLATPERLWLSTGMRAVDHAVENLYRRGVPYPLKVLCYDALAAFFMHLPASKSDPSNIEIRQKLQIASWMSLWPLKQEGYAPVGLSHALGHRLGAKYGIPHGITSCLTLAPVVALQARFAAPEHKRALARAAGHLCIESAGSEDADIQLLAHAVEHLVINLGLKTDLKACGVPREDLPTIAEGALKSREEPLFGEVVKILESLYPD